MTKDNLVKILAIDKEFRLTELKEIDDTSVVAEVERKGKIKCRRCGSRQKTTIHDRAHKKSSKLHNTIADEKKIYIKYFRHRYRCGKCGNKFMDYGFGVRPYWRFTGNMIRIFFKHMAKEGIVTVSKKFGIHYRTLEKLLNEMVKEEVDWSVFKHQDTIRLGIDEHSFSGHRMVITVVELVSSTPLIILKKDTKKELKKFLNSIPWWIKRRIDEVAIDMRTRNKYAVEEELSGVNIVADRFHVERDANMRFDWLRKIQQEISSQRQGRRVNIPRRIFFRKNLNNRQKARIQHYLKKYPELKLWYEYKNRVNEIYRQKNKSAARNHIEKLIRDLSSSEDSDLNKWAKSLDRWKEQILNYYDNRTTIAMVEGYHNPIKLLKRISFGFKDVDLYVKKVMLGLVPHHVLCLEPNF